MNVGLSKILIQTDMEITLVMMGPSAFFLDIYIITDRLNLQEWKKDMKRPLNELEQTLVNGPSSLPQAAFCYHYRWVKF